MIPASPAHALGPWTPSFAARWLASVRLLLGSDPFFALLVSWVLAQFRWGRRFLGGKWECWWSEFSQSYVWREVDDWSCFTLTAPVCCRGKAIRFEEDGVEVSPRLCTKCKAPVVLYPPMGHKRPLCQPCGNPR